MSKLDINTRVKLLDGNTIPQLGFGTYESDGKECYNSVLWALEAGYRHIDTAEWYENEAETGAAIRDFIKSSGVTREEIFYTTKLKVNGGYEHVKKAIRKSLKEAGLDYLDLFVHGPYPDKEARLASWKAIEEAVQEGLIKSAGVSNYAIRHLEELYATNPKVLPAINQIDVHPFMTREKEVEFNKKHNIAIEAWGPLARAMRFNNPTLQSIAKKYSKSPAQVLIRWSLQKGYIPLPKSVTKERVIANTQVFDFELTSDEVETLSGLDEYLVTDWDPIGDSSV